jgi:NCS2 family nucleobase:cation symporter-2
MTRSIRKRPADLVYGLDDTPPLTALVLLGLQHVSIACVSLLIPLMVAKAAGLPAEALPSLISFSMIAIAMTTWLQAYRFKGLGAGYLIPGYCTSNYLSASIAAAQVGGMPLVYGMTLFAGMFELTVSRLLIRLRPYFPPEISGLAVTILGIELGVIAFRNIMGFHHPEGASLTGIAIGFATFGLTFLLNIYGAGSVRLFCSLIGVAVGYVAAIAAGLLSDQSASLLRAAPVIDLPQITHIGFSFDPAMLVVFMLASLASMLKTMGSVTTCQKINDASWVRPDMAEIQRGVAADGVSTVLAGFMGSTGQNPSTSNISISSATGATSRRIALPIIIWLLVMACSPKLASIFVIMPEAVIGGALLFAACFILVSGLQIVASRMLDVRRTAVIGLALILAISRYAFADEFKAMPAAVQPFVTSALSIGVFTAIVLNLILRIGVHKRAKLALRLGEDHTAQMTAFMEQCGGSWGARAPVVQNAAHALVELSDALSTFADAHSQVTVNARFDEFSIDLSVNYRGQLMVMPGVAPTSQELMDNPDRTTDLGLLMLTRLADKVRITSDSAQDHTVHLHFQH